MKSFVIRQLSHHLWRAVTREELAEPDRRRAGGGDCGDTPREAGRQHETNVEGGLQPDHLRRAKRDDAAKVNEQREYLPRICSARAALKQRTCSAHAQCTCSAHAVHMQCTCTAQAAHI